jgi:histidyl-tRNA synthetase
MQKPSLPKGTRDFLPKVAAKRKYIIQCIEESFISFGFKPIETPAMENLSTLTGNYGEEGDKLLFKVLNNGDFLSKVKLEILPTSNELLPQIAEKGLRYDLTVPFARFVVQNRNEITFPFRRYQIQPVWRADRPQKGRYREFYQCDADIIGTDSLLSEYELICLYSMVFEKLNIQDYIVKVNNRKILEGVAEVANCKDQFKELTIAIDKLDKIGIEGVEKELLANGFNENSIKIIKQSIRTFEFSEEGLAQIEQIIGTSPIGLEGLDEMKEIISLFNTSKPNIKIELDLKLARGLDYYTGCIFEAVPTSIKMGSISGGGRYDSLTEIFGLKGVSGVGISFGLDRIYDLMDELDLFKKSNSQGTQILFCPMDKNAIPTLIEILNEHRLAGIPSEIYPKADKLKKQLDYANKNEVHFCAIMGSQELENKEITLKNMHSGEQQSVKLEDLLILMHESI